MQPIRYFLTASLVAFAIAALSAGYCWAEDIEDKNVMLLSGNISAVDTFNSTITVKWQGADLISYEYLTFTVPEGMTFYRGSDKIDILDVNVEDPVNAEYYFDKNGTPKLVRLQIGQ